jgi:PKD repeat protein
VNSKIIKNIKYLISNIENYLFVFFIVTVFSCSPKYNPENGPMAYFKCNKTRAYISSEISFENLSKGSEFCVWDFGNGNISLEQNPSIKYNETGTFKVTLSVKNGAKTNVYSREIEIVKQPISYTITGVEIQKMPFFDHLGNPWDGALQGVYPDVYVKLVNRDNSILYSYPVNKRKENLGPAMLPTKFNIEFNSNLIFRDFNQSISVALFDFDSFSSDQLISTASPLFSINYFYENAVTPDRILLTGYNTLINLDISWQY